MKKLVRGIVEFRQNIRPGFRETFARLALGQSPDTLFIACSDSRVVPNLFASTDPGDLFVVRNVGNLVPACGDEQGRSNSDESEAAAIEFAVRNLGVSDIVVCGHSECGAMQAILNGRHQVPMPNLRSWLRHGELALQAIEADPQFAAGLAPHNRLSQRNVLQQVEHLRSYPIIRERLDQGALRVHAWWFELASASVYGYDEKSRRFVEIDETYAELLLNAH